MGEVHLARAIAAEKTARFPDFGPAPIEGECHEVVEVPRIERDPDPSLPAS